MQIGRKIYYEKNTGNVLVDKGEMQGDVRETSFGEDCLAYPQLETYSEETVGILQLAYGERTQEFNNLGSMKVIDNELIIYPKLTIVSDKYEIITDGVDTATITVTIHDASNVYDISYTVNDGDQVIVNTVDGVATLQFDTTLPGTYIIKAESDIYGSSSITIKGV